MLLTQPTRELVDVQASDLGEHRLKDLLEPQRLFQLGTDDFPPLKTLDWTNLPVQATPLVGREQELADAIALLQDQRLLTLVGPPALGRRVSPCSSRPKSQTSSSTSGGSRSIRSTIAQLVESTIAQSSAPGTISRVICAIAEPCSCWTTWSRSSTARLASPSWSPLRATSSCSPPAASRSG